MKSVKPLHYLDKVEIWTEIIICIDDGNEE